MPEPRVAALLIGGGVASVRCARTLRREGIDGRLVIVGAEDLAPYNRPPLSKELLRDELPDELVAAEARSWYERRGVDLLLADPVMELDLDARLARTASGRALSFERVLIATGAVVRSPAVPGAERVLTLRTLADSRRIRRAAVEAGPQAPAAVIGGGFIGVEVASALASLGLRPTLLELAPALWGGALGRALSDWAVDMLASAGVDVRLNAAATAVTADAVDTGAGPLPAALVVAGVGVAPHVALATSAGIAVDGGVLVDDGGRTSHPAAWAAGDVARRRGQPRIEHWHAAREGGERAARSMLGAPIGAAPPAWVFSEVAGVPLDVIGATTPWEEERWLDRTHAVLGYVAAERVVGLAVIGSVVPPAEARAWVADATLAAEVERRLA